MLHEEKMFAQLVSEINKTINEQVIFTNVDGIIVASTEKERIGAFHEGAKRSIQQKTYLYMTEEKVNELVGVRKGVVTPIFLNKNAIGVVGITGEPEYIQKFILIVQRLAELFLENTIDRITEENMLRNIELFVLDWVNETLSLKELKEYSTIYQIDLNKIEQVTIMYSEDVKEITTEVLKELKSMWPKVALLVRWGQGRILVLHPYVEKSHLIKIIHNFRKAVLNKYNYNLLFGVGKKINNFHIQKSFQEAHRALIYASNFNRIIFEEDLFLEQIEYALPKDLKNDFIYKTIKPIAEDEELFNTLSVFLKNDLKIDRAAKQLHIHKNTLYYRLNKIKDISGFDVNKVEHITIMYMSILFYENRNRHT